MKVSVWDTYVRREDGKVMHFDIVVPDTMIDPAIVYEYGRIYLASRPYGTGNLTSEECRFCHLEQASETMIQNIQKQGYHIIEMQNCE